MAWPVFLRTMLLFALRRCGNCPTCQIISGSGTTWLIPRWHPHGIHDTPWTVGVEYCGLEQAGRSSRGSGASWYVLVNGLEMIRPIDASSDALRRQLRDHSIIWVGAGASIAAGYPSTAQLVGALRQAADDPLTGEDFPKVTDEFVRSRGEGALRVLLQREIGSGRPPTSFHRALARLAKAGQIHTVITTNYDDLIERTLAEHGVPHLLQTLEANFEAAGRDTVRVVKIHGSYHDWSRVILSGESYIRFEAAYQRLVEQMSVLCRQYPVTFVGSSLLEPRVLGWLAKLSPAERRNLLPWRAFLTSQEWARLLEYKTNDFEASNVLVGQFRPLILKEHSALQGVWTEICEDLAKQERHVTAEIAPASDVSDFGRSVVLLQRAFAEVHAASDGGGPFTHLHRRIDVSQRWLREAKKLLRASPASGGSEADALNYLRGLTETLSEYAAEVKRRLPRAAGDTKASDAPTKDFPSRLYVIEGKFSDWVQGGGVLNDISDSMQWNILGFEDIESYDDYVYPRLAQLVRCDDSRVHRLVRRLVDDPKFTPAGLESEGHRASIVMDVLNALLRENGATWTAPSEKDTHWEGAVTPGGRELLLKLTANVTSSRSQ
jgi:NAD-dependent SIR2 family protein deacetylase